MAENSSYKAMEALVLSSPKGAILFPDDFTMCGTPDAVRSGLTRLCKNGILLRYAKGIYYTPKYDKWNGDLLKPSLVDVAERIAERDNARIVPTGAYALNRLGLSTQVPANIVYITDGSARQVKFEGKKKITFLHSNDLANFAYQSDAMQTIVMALREIGQDQLTGEQFERVKDVMSKHVSEEEYKHDIVLAPIWIKTLLQKNQA